MKILFVSREFPTGKYVNYGIFEMDQAKALVKAGIEVIFVSVNLASIRRYRKFGYEEKTIEGVKIYGYNIPCGRIPKRISSAIRLFFLKKLYKIVFKKEGRPDLIHTHFITAGYTCVKANEKYKVPVVMTEHFSEMIQKPIKPYFYNLGLKTYNNIDKLICVSESLKDSIKKNFRQDSEYIPNMININLFKGKLIKNKKFRFISVGNLKYSKRMDLTIKAFINNFKNYKDIELIIIGDGPEKKKLKQIIKKNKMEDKIKMLGFQPREKVAEEMKKSKCFVLPSQFETFGVAYCEAMASGLPVIATKCGGPESFVNSSNGYFIEIDNLKELQEAMLWMYNNIEKYDSDKISKFIEKNFDSKVVARKIINVYKEVLNKKLAIKK